MTSINKIIKVPAVSRYHFHCDNKKLTGCHFEEISPKTNIINKIIIQNIEYATDEIYNRTDGYAGNCWETSVADSRMIDDIYQYKLVFRNFGDLVKYYEDQGFKFVEQH